MSKCVICGKEATDTGFWWGQACEEEAHMECVLKEAGEVCSDNNCGVLTVTSAGMCPDCGEETKPFTDKMKDAIRIKKKGNRKE